jgi:hypothetical protein
MGVDAHGKALWTEPYSKFTTKFSDLHTDRIHVSAAISEDSNLIVAFSHFDTYSDSTFGVWVASFVVEPSSFVVDVFFVLLLCGVVGVVFVCVLIYLKQKRRLHVVEG